MLANLTLTMNICFDYVKGCPTDLSMITKLGSYCNSVSHTVVQHIERHVSNSRPTLQCVIIQCTTDMHNATHPLRIISSEINALPPKDAPSLSFP